MPATYSLSCCFAARSRGEDHVSLIVSLLVSRRAAAAAVLEAFEITIAVMPVADSVTPIQPHAVVNTRALRDGLLVIREAMVLLFANRFLCFFLPSPLGSRLSSEFPFDYSPEEIEFLRSQQGMDTQIPAKTKSDCHG